MARTQIAVIPFIMHRDQPMILMVTSRETRRWIVPKGWQEKKVTDGIRRHARPFEEAGAIGVVSDKPMGSYRYDKRLKNGSLKPWTLPCTPCTSKNCWMTGRRWKSGNAAG